MNITTTQKQGWMCPQCGKAHGPHVDTCPEPRKDAAPVVVPSVWDHTHTMPWWARPNWQTPVMTLEAPICPGMVYS